MFRDAGNPNILERKSMYKRMNCKKKPKFSVFGDDPVPVKKHDRWEARIEFKLFN